MKKLYFLLTALCLFTGATAQIINIPDANFKTKLLAANTNNTIAKDVTDNPIKIDINDNGEIEINEVLLIYKIDISSNTHDDLDDIANLSGIEYFENLTWVNCRGNAISNLDLTALTKLKYLDAGINKMQILNITGLTDLEYLDCYVNHLSSLNLTNFPNLKTLECGGNDIVSLNLSSCTNLEKFSGCCNPITSLNVSNLSKLTEIYIPQIKIASLDASNLISLIKLNCESNINMTSLTLSGTVNLQYLYSGYNSLKSIDFNSLSKLNTLDVSNNQIENIDLSELVNLERLSLSRNLITSIDLTNNNKTKYLDLGFNKLATINLENKDLLIQLSVNNNLLTELDLNKFKNISYLNCNSNLLNSLLIKNGNDVSLNFDKNPNLKYICVDDNAISSLQEQINHYGYTNCQVNSYCSFTPGSTFYTIYGNTKLNSDNNNCDENDTVYPNLKFSITDGTTAGGFISNAIGNYSIPVETGTHTVTPVIENPSYFTISPSNFQVSFPSATSPYMQNFCITPNGVHNDLEVMVVPLQAARPGFDAKYKMVYKNKGTNAQSGTVSLNFDDAVLDFVSANPVTSNQQSSILAWDFTDLHPFETREITFTLNVNTPEETPAVKNDDMLHYTATVTSTDAEETPMDNAFSLNQIVVGSFDPNDKTCLEGNVITPALIGEYVHYMIRFENTGNYQAQNIVVKDMIDLSKFDISTLAPTDASHDFVTKITNGNKVEFIFENINLPFDDATNDGYIAFKIKTLSTLVVGNSFENEANIYFDYNFPILTNKAKSTFQALGVQDFEFSNYFSLYPNPVSDVLKLSTKATIEVNSISIYNTLGQTVIAIPNAETVSGIDVANLTSGAYFVKVNTNKGTSNAKFIKN